MHTVGIKDADMQILVSGELFEMQDPPERVHDKTGWAALWLTKLLLVADCTLDEAYAAIYLTSLVDSHQDYTKMFGFKPLYEIRPAAYRALPTLKRILKHG